MGRLIDEYEDIKTQQECVSKTIATLWEMAQKYQKLQADYETRLKADMEAMLTELQLEIEEIDSRAGYDGNGMPTFANDYVRIIKVNEIIQEKISALKGEEDVDKT